jgi:hypothetical protein
MVNKIFKSKGRHVQQDGKKERKILKLMLKDQKNILKLWNKIIFLISL